MIRRVAAAALLAAAVAAAAAPGLLGIRARTLYLHGLEALAARGYVIRQSSYRPGWIRSRAVALVEPPEPSPLPALHAETLIRHGPRGDDWLAWPPVLALIDGEIRAAESGAPDAAPEGGPGAPLRFRGRVAMDGKLDVVAELPRAGVDTAGSVLRIGGFESRFLAGKSSFGGDGKIDAVRITAPDDRVLRLSTLGWDFSLLRSEDPLPSGDLRLSLDRLRVEDPQAPDLFEVQGLGFRSGAAIVEQRAALTLALSLDALRLADTGPYAADVRLALTGLDAASAVALWQGLVRLSTQQLPESLRGLAIGTLLNEHLDGLLPEGARLAVEQFRLGTPEGAVDASLDLALAGTGQSGQGAWLKRLAGEARLAMPQPLLLQLLASRHEQRVREELRHRGEPAGPLPATLQTEIAEAAQSSLMGLIGDGWLVPDRGRLAAAAVIGNGLLTVNGKTVPVGL